MVKVNKVCIMKKKPAFSSKIWQKMHKAFFRGRIYVLLLLILAISQASATTGNFDNDTNTWLLFDFNNSLVGNHDITFGLSLQAGSNVFSYDQLGQANEAIKFSSGNYYRINDTIPTWPSGSNGSVDFLFRCDPSASQETMLDVDTGGSRIIFQLLSNSSLMFLYRDSGFNTDQYISPIVYDDGNYHYFTAIRDQLTSSTYYYIDGLLDTTGGFGATGQLIFNDVFYVGADSGGGDLADPCEISSLRITNETRSDSDVQIEYFNLFGSPGDNLSLTINFLDGITNANLTNYNISYSVYNSTNLVSSGSTISGTVTVNEVPNTTITVNSQILNITNYPPTQASFLIVYNQTRTVVFYQNTSYTLYFRDLLTNTSITDAVTYQIVGTNAYTGTSTTGSASETVEFDTYDLQARVNVLDWATSTYTDQILTNSTTISGTQPSKTLYMYFINSTSDGGGNFTATVRDQTASPVEGAVVHIQKYDIGTNSYLTQQILTTNFEGQIRFPATLYEETYKFLIFYDNELVFTSNPTTLFNTQINFFINIFGEVGTAYFLLDEFSYAISYDNSTMQTSLTWTGLTDLNNMVCLNVTKTNTYGTLTQLNGTCNTAPSGSITINILNQTEETTLSIQAYLYTETGSEEKNILDGITVFFPGAQVTGRLGMFLTLMLVILGIGVGWWNPGIIPVSTTFMLFISGLMGLHYLPTALTFTILIVGLGVTIWVSDKT